MIETKRLMEKTEEEAMENMILDQVIKNKVTISNLKKITESVIRHLESNAILEKGDSGIPEPPRFSHQ